MKYLDEYREAGAVKRYAEALHRFATRPWTVMEICGGQTHSIVRYGIDELLPPEIRLVHGPGCPVCVTPVDLIDKALHLASRPDVIFTTFGDMMRVPGTGRDLLSVKAAGGDVRMVYSPLDALRIALERPDRQVVFFGVGFETTAPATAMALYQAKKRGVDNFAMLVSHVLVPPAMEAILSSPKCRVQGFLAAGHVCSVMGYHEYFPVAEKYRVPIVVTGFEPVDILQGLTMLVRQLEEGRAEVENQYSRSVTRAGNTAAQELMSEVFVVASRKWRGVGDIPRSGLALAPAYASFDAEKRFGLTHIVAEEPAECRSGEVLQGLIRPHECEAFGTRCTPERPLGAPMVSSEGACAAYYRYRGQAVPAGKEAPPA